ncbi:MAG: hypothetical protein IPM54_05490 [Polyangiaceae bacterium]|nr:hypothetical protein [Polyangiaceae bacterium]
MTAIYHALRPDGYEIVNTVGGYEDGDALRALGGSSRKHDWKPILVERVRGTRRRGFKPSDLTCSPTAFVLRRSAVDALQDIIDAHGEVLPLATSDGVELFVFNPRFVIDAFDRERSIFEQVPETNILWIRKYVFIETAIRGIDIFRMPIPGAHSLFFSDRFVERVKAAKLKGTDFIKLWSSDESAQSGA